MNIKLPRSFTLALPFAALSAMPLTGFAETFTGTLNGHGCAHASTSCPSDKMDPHIALEPDFILQQANGEYYFLTNLPRSTKVRYVLDEVVVDGKLNKKYHSIMVKEFKVKDGGGFKTVWSQEWEKQAAEAFNLGYDGG